MLKTSVLLTLIVGMASCAAIKKSNVLDTEQKLSVSGFIVEYANTDEKLYKLKTLKQHKVVLLENNGSVYYIFADVEFCKCSYAGSEEAYQNFLSLVAKENSDEMYENEDDHLYLRGIGIYGRGC